MRIYQRYIKRLMDLILSGTAFIILSPIFIVSAVVVRIKLGSPILFKQARPGKREKIFYLYKFRSMTSATDKNGKLLPDNERLTKIGNFLRKSSIDELPELFNIIKGDMSIVGPRPLSIYYLPHYTSVEKKRHNVRPGLTGLAQINGRNNLPWDERFEQDVQYVENVTFLNDMKIILNTVLKVLKASDISVRGTTKMYDFGTYKRIQEEGYEIKMNRYKTTYSEIGSYYWLESIPSVLEGKPKFLPNMKECAFTFSGRTAIEIALKDALKHNKIRKVYVPSYCCVSMLQTFIDNNIKYEFYEVKLGNGRISYEIDENKECDMILFMRYFSMDYDEISHILKKMKTRGIIVVEDITHTLLDNNAYLEVSDYLVASLRKWFAIPTGGWVGKRKGILEVKPNKDSNHTVIEKIKGMHMKYQYMNGEKISKEEFIKINSKFDNDLIHVDRMLKLDDTSLGIMSEIDIEFVKMRRKLNAQILENKLSDLESITLPVINLEESTPLFYPIFLNTEERDSLREYLIKEGMYCPIHWPEVMGATSGIRENELSLICDQRYTEKDMYALSDCIHEWYKNR